MDISIPEESRPNARQLLLTALLHSWEKYCIGLQRCQAELSNDAVHDFRVATRRLLALLQLLNSLSPRPRLQKLIRTFKQQLNEFDDLRDTQITLAETSKILHVLPQLQVFQTYLEETEQKIFLTLGEKLEKLDTSKIDKRIRRTYEALASEVRDELEAEVLQAIDDAFLLAKIRLRWIDLSRSATIHRVRVAFKAFRYMVEMIYPMLNDFPSENLRRMHDYQTRMGDIQDTEVFLQTFTDISQAASHSDLEPVSRYYDRRQIEAVSAYIQNVNQLRSFWRSAEDQSFPWDRPRI
jgi:CHAD domain-containing protein